MDWITIITFVSRCFGLGEWLEGLLKQREIKKQAQDLANEPANNKEESDWWKH